MSDLQTRHPDSAGLSRVCGHLLRLAQQVHNAQWLEEVGSDPTSPQYAVLAAIAAAPGADQRHVSDVASLDTSSTMDVVARLAGRGWVTRARSPSDARRDILTPAAGAVDALASLRTKVQRVQERLLAALPVEARGEFTELLRRTARVDPRGEDGTYSPLHIPGHLLRRAQQVHTALFAAEFDRELTGPQYAALRVLATHPSISQRELGELAALDKSTAADLVQRLARRGWITREPDAADGRRRVLSLSPAGESAVSGFTPRVALVQERLLEPLTPQDRERFLALLAPVAYIAAP